MNSEKIKKESLIGELKHRCHILRLEELGLILLQLVGLGSCTIFIISNLFNWTIGNLIISTRYYIFTLKGEYLSPFCFVISILLAIPRPENLRNKINVLNPAIHILRTKKNFSSWENSIIEQAKAYITEVDKYHQKKKEGREHEIEPHEKRMVLRKRMIIFGIPGFIILTLFLIIVFGCTLPQIIAIDMALGYSMVIIESAYYQGELKKADVLVMTEKYKEKIIDELILQEHYLFLQKVLYMKADRYLNYCLVLGVASSVLNILAILLTLLDASSNDVLKRLFAIDAIDVNTQISMIFMGISIIFYFLDLFLNYYLGPKIVELKAKADMEYSITNYKSLQEDWNHIKSEEDILLHNELCQQIWTLLFKPFKPCNTIFSHRALDMGRGRYDYNNDSLVKNRGNKIPAVCMSTVEDSFPGRVPRFKLTAFVIWLVLFCFFVWAKADINNLIPISVISLILYNFIILFFGIRTWNGMQKWLLFEKEKSSITHLTREVKWDFLSYFLGYSVLILFLLLFEVSYVRHYLMTTMLIALIPAILFFNIIGYRLAKKHSTINIPLAYVDYGVVVLAVIGIIHILLKKELNVQHFLFWPIVIPGFIEMIASYFKRVRKSKEKLTIKVPFCALFLLINWCSIIVLLQSHQFFNENYVITLGIWLYIVVAVLLFSGVVYGIKQVYDKTIE